MRSPQADNPQTHQLSNLFHQLGILLVVDGIAVGQPCVTSFLQLLQHTKYRPNGHFGVGFRRHVALDGLLKKFPVVFEIRDDQDPDGFTPSDGLQAEDGAVVHGEGFVGVKEMLETCPGEPGFQGVG